MASRRLLLFPAIVATIAINAACGDPPGPPSIASIAPEEERRGFTATQEIEVMIQGNGFHERVVPDTQNPNGSKLAQPFVLVDSVLVRSSYDGPTQIRAYLDIGTGAQALAVGFHDIDVVNPDGSSARSTTPFRVIGPPTHLRLTSGVEPGPPASSGTSNVVILSYYVLDTTGMPVG